MSTRLAALREEHPVIGDVRGRGAMMAIELCAPGTTDPDPARTAAVRAASGSWVPGDISSIACIAPRPRMSAITGCCCWSASSRVRMTAPTSRARAARSWVRISSIDPRAAAQATGLPP